MRPSCRRAAAACLLQAGCPHPWAQQGAALLPVPLPPVVLLLLLLLALLLCAAAEAGWP